MNVCYYQLRIFLEQPLLCAEPLPTRFLEKNSHRQVADHRTTELWLPVQLSDMVKVRIWKVIQPYCVLSQHTSVRETRQWIVEFVRIQSDTYCRSEQGPGIVFVDLRTVDRKVMQRQHQTVIGPQALIELIKHSVISEVCLWNFKAGRWNLKTGRQNLIFTTKTAVNSLKSYLHRSQRISSYQTFFCRGQRHHCKSAEPHRL